MSAGHRPIVPAPKPRSDRTDVDASGEANAHRTDRFLIPKRTRVVTKKIVAVACHACRKRKSRCGGERPICSSCKARGLMLPCHYETEHRSSSLKRKAADLQKELEQLKKEKSKSFDKEFLVEEEEEDAAKPIIINRPVVVRPPTEAELLRNELQELKSILPILVAAPSTHGAKSRLVEEIQENGMSDAARRQVKELERNKLPTPSSSDIDHLSDLDPNFAMDRNFLPVADFTPNTLNYQSQKLPYDPVLEPSGSSLAWSDDLLVPGAVNPLAFGIPGVVKEQEEEIEVVVDKKPSKHRMAVNVFGFGNLPMSSSIRTNGYPSLTQTSQLTNFSLPTHLLSPLWLEPEMVEGADTRWVNSLFCNIRLKGRSMIESGIPMEMVLGPAFPETIDLSSSVIPQDPEGATSISDFVARFMGYFSHFSVSDRVAGWVMIYHILRWQIFPSAETFLAIPEWYRPVPSQSFIPHMASLDILVWPEAREMLINAPTDFASQIMGTISVSWPYSDSEIFLRNQLSGLLEINPVFEAWCLDINNWSLDSAILREMPQFAGKAKFR